MKRNIVHFCKAETETEDEVSVTEAYKPKKTIQHYRGSPSFPKSFFAFQSLHVRTIHNYPILNFPFPCRVYVRDRRIYKQLCATQSRRNRYQRNRIINVQVMQAWTRNMLCRKGKYMQTEGDTWKTKEM